MNNVLVKIEDLNQHFDIKLPNGKKALIKALNGVSFEIYEGETFGLVGESGCGKSTLGKALLKTYPITSGSIYFKGSEISNLKGNELKSFRCNTQMIFQDPSSCLNPRRRIRQILKEPYIVHKMYSDSEREEKVRALCEMVGLSESFLDRFPHEMSGGQKQRVGIARALALRPKLIVCDEPVSALDVSIQAQVINLLCDLQDKLSLTYLFISHNLSVVKHCCQRIGVMYLGKIVELASSERLYENPLHPYTKALISAIPDIETDGTERTILSGDLPSPIAIPRGCPFHSRCPECLKKCKTEIPIQAEVEPDHFVSCHLYTK